MINCNHQIRLTSLERQQLRLMTGADTGYIKTKRQLEQFIKGQLSRLECNMPGACLARRVLVSYLNR